jgi:hypothetical protein
MLASLTPLILVEAKHRKNIPVNDEARELTLPTRVEQFLLDPCFVVRCVAEPGTEGDIEIGGVI